MSPTDTYEITLGSNESPVSRLPKLAEDGSNWVLFKAQFKATVSSKGLLRFLEGRNKIPIELTAPGVDSDADENYENALDIWTGKHEAIHALLFQTIPETMKLRILSLPKASDAWNLVCKQYENQGEFVQMDILTRMHALTTENGSDPRPTLNELQRLCTEYAAAGGSLDDAGYKAIILKCLPLSYRGVLHCRMGHAYSPALLKMVRAGVVKGIRLSD
ncbi:hypothetical protein POSPLADRAFT_1103200, partial [Postia placenta MAD-698-R-SB12]